jgi:hypothetical protein
LRWWARAGRERDVISGWARSRTENARRDVVRDRSAAGDATSPSPDDSDGLAHTEYAAARRRARSGLRDLGPIRTASGSAFARPLFGGRRAGTHARRRPSASSALDPASPSA